MAAADNHLALDFDSLPADLFSDARSVEFSDEEILADLRYPGPADARGADVIPAALKLSLPRAA